MKFNEAWLREWVDPGLTASELGERLTMAGLELDSISPVAGEFTNVVVAVVNEVAPHPEAERLSICQVDDGGSEALQVVCGAPNVTAGMKAPLARVGARLPDGVRIRRAKLRGRESQGMLCSPKELGLGDDADGLLSLPADAPVGDPLGTYLDLGDVVLDVNLTPNRGDCLSIAGLAREIASITGQVLKAPVIEPVAPTIDDTFPVELLHAQACPRYAGRIIRGIDASAPTPLWMKERLRRCGVRSIAAVVDVTNYVMLELGQPMHAFDFATLAGGIRVRLAVDGESLELLDGQTPTLDSETLVIADHDKAVALAGIMGGLATGVSATSHDIFLESAFFSPLPIAGKARGYGLHTDASHRFERGVDPALQVRAIERATGLLLEIAGGSAGPVIDVADEQYLPQRAPVELAMDNVRRLLGVSVPLEEARCMLTSLGCEVSETGAGRMQVTPPSFRFDLAIEADLIEEIGRLYGYDNIPSTVPVHAAVIHERANTRRHLSTLRQVLADRDYQEAITYSFVDEDWNRWFSPESQGKRLANPISADLAVMRSTLWPGLLKALNYNLNRQQSRARLFETGLRFLDESAGLVQTPTLAGVVTGPVLQEQWGTSTQHVDFFDVKGDVEALLAVCGLQHHVEFVARTHPALHPGQSAAVESGDGPLGWIGALHPELERRLGLEQSVYLFELDLASLEHGDITQLQALSRFPGIRRDISVVVDDSISARQLRQSIVKAGVSALREVHLFDVYRGKGVADGRKSCSLGLILQDLSRTLKDEEVDDYVARIVGRLSNELGASLRI